MRQKRGRGCPGKCRSIVAFASRQTPSQQYVWTGWWAPPFFFFYFALFTLPSVKGRGGSRGAWLAERNSLERY